MGLEYLGAAFHSPYVEMRRRLGQGLHRNEAVRLPENGRDRPGDYGDNLGLNPALAADNDWAPGLDEFAVGSPGGLDTVKDLLKAGLHVRPARRVVQARQEAMNQHHGLPQARLDIGHGVAGGGTGSGLLFCSHSSG